MSDTNEMTLQEAAIAAGFEDFILEPGGGIRVWDTNQINGDVFSEEYVKLTAKLKGSK